MVQGGEGGGGMRERESKSWSGSGQRQWGRKASRGMLLRWTHCSAAAATKGSVNGTGDKQSLAGGVHYKNQGVNGPGFIDKQNCTWPG